MEPAALEYERKDRVPPYLEAVPGRVTLVLPPIPRRLAISALTIQALLWVVMTSLALVMAILWLTRDLFCGATGVLAVAAVVMAWDLIIQAKWFLRDSRDPFLVEICEGELRYHRKSVFGPLRTSQRPLSKVRGFSASEYAGTEASFRIDLRPVGNVRWVFLAPRKGFAAEVEQAFTGALAEWQEREPLCSTG